MKIETHTAGKGCKLLQSPYKTLQHYLFKLNICLLYDPAIALLSIYLAKMSAEALYKNV